MLDMNTGLYSFDTASADVVITLSTPAKPSRWSIGGIAWSYEGGTLSTAAALEIFATRSDTASTDVGASDQVFKVHINDDGAGFITPAEPFKFPPAHAVRIVLRSAGATVDSNLNVLGAKLV